MQQWSGHAQFEFTDDRFSRNAVHNVYPTIVDACKVRRILDITVYLQHYPETQVNRANIQNIPVVKIEVL